MLGAGIPPPGFANQELGDLRAVRDGKSLQVDVAVAGPGCRLALGIAGARHLEPALSARTQPASEAARLSNERPGSLMAMTSPQRLTQAEAIFFPQAFYLEAVQWSKLNMIMC